MRVPDFWIFYGVFWVFGHFDRWLMTGRNVLSMVRSERKIVNSPTTIAFDNRTVN
ncbi:hypothetical protein [Pseudomonas frederiksbergensis]|uniref:hypothetical protein n=1 Tax=Pseudomonas frederiksbergensis TaxID=104087 RepID=UPI0013747C7B|nr:hypothetical protein [Pseudomonas frederiksbergensis]